MAYLRDKQMLIVIDRFEHLVEGAPLITQLLQRAPGIKILVTSRERLNLNGEWVYTLQGMDRAPDENVDDLAVYDAERLFLQAARRVALGFQVRDADKSHLVRICQMVAGLPLALELAASWVRVLSLETIAANITRQLDFLSSATRDRPERHRSIRAVFDQSWSLLSADEQKTLRRLSVFRGEFRQQEALAVSEGSLKTLRSLVDRSLIRRLPSGRLQLHDLVRQYAREKLDLRPGETPTTRNRHTHVYAAHLGRYKEALKDNTHHAILQLGAKDRENILAAWAWAVEQRDVQAVSAMRDAVADMFHLTTSFQEGEHLFSETLSKLGRTDRHEIRDLLACKLLSSRSTFAVYLGRLEQAHRDLTHCLSVFEQHEDQDEMAYCRFFLGEIARFVGNFTSAKESFTQSLTGYRQVGNRSAAGFSLNGLGLVSAALGELPQARTYLQESLITFEETHNEMGQAIATINLADALIKAGDHPAATRVLERGYELCRQLGHRWGMATCLRYQGDIARGEQRLEEARASYETSLAILQDIGQRQATAGTLIKLGEVCSDVGNSPQAIRHLKQALLIALDLGDQAQTVEATKTLTQFLTDHGQIEQAVTLALLVEARSADTQTARQQVGHLVSEIAKALPDETIQRCRRESNAQTLEVALSALIAAVPP